ncbi:MAG: hypothetical protein EXS34_04950, partial [Lacunisphaera sp.]|nr:hypothetical protein [Lacunisphaera sp.]
MNTQRRQLRILFQLTLAALLAQSLRAADAGSSSNSLAVRPEDFAVRAPAAEPPRPHPAVVVVIDGLRPDFVSPETTPQLAKLAAAGVFFAHHHPVYLSSTEVNGTALATGSYPAHSGIIANNEFRPRLDPQNAIATQAPDMVRRGDELSGGHYLARPTVAEILHAQGLATAIAGSKPVALLHDRALPSATPGVSALVSQGEARPEAVTTALKATQGALPSATERDD